MQQQLADDEQHEHRDDVLAIERWWRTLTMTDSLHYRVDGRRSSGAEHSRRGDGAAGREALPRPAAPRSRRPREAEEIGARGRRYVRPDGRARERSRAIATSPAHPER